MGTEFYQLVFSLLVDHFFLKVAYSDWLLNVNIAFMEFNLVIMYDQPHFMWLKWVCS